MAYPVLAPNSTWYKSSVARSTITQIDIVNSASPTSYDESWNADVGNTGSIKCYRTGTVITMAGNGTGKIAMNADSSNLFYTSSDYFTSLITINNLNLLDSSNVTDMSYMFARAVKLKSLDLSSWNVSNVTNMKYMFASSEKSGYMALEFVDVSTWNTSNVTDTQFMFNYCSSLTTLDVSNWNTGSITTMKCMFQQSNYGQYSELTTLDVSNWDTSNVIDMSYAFYGLSKLTYLDVSKWDVSKVETFNHLFAHCSNLDLVGYKNWDTSNVIDFNGTFHGLKTISYDLSGWDVSKAQSFAQMFENNQNLVEIKGLEKFDTSSCVNFYQMFGRCHSLVELNLSSFDTRNATKVMMFYDTNPNEAPRNLREIKVSENFVFTGSGINSCPFPTPTSEYIDGANGLWYSPDGKNFNPSEIPSGVATTYYAVCPFENVLIEYNTLISLGKTLRKLTGVDRQYTPAEMISTLDTLLSTENGYWKYLLEDGTLTDSVDVQSVTANEGIVSKIKLGNTFVYGGPMNNLALKGTTDAGGAALYNGIGYCDDMRWSSSSAKPTSGGGARLSGWMPYEKGAILRIKNFGLNKTGYVQGGYIVYYGSDGKVTTTTIGAQSEDFYTTTFSSTSNYLYFRVSGYLVDATPIITLNEQIVEGW